MIELRKITEDNFDDVIELKVASGQENFLSSNVYSLAEAYANVINNEKPYMPFAIYNNDEVIGFAMIEFVELDEDNFFNKNFGDKTGYYLFRFMIDEKHQGKGLGRQSLIKIIELLKSFPQGKANLIAVSYELSNEVVRKLYASLGFVETSLISDGDVFARLGL